MAFKFSYKMGSSLIRVPLRVLCTREPPSLGFLQKDPNLENYPYLKAIGLLEPEGKPEDAVRFC